MRELGVNAVCRLQARSLGQGGPLHANLRELTSLCRMACRRDLQVVKRPSVSGSGQEKPEFVV